ncbi:FmdB family transcriptional regulator [Deinococcus irradiatisoli]|uniref:FmdB family transcriptional regulator n=1 Tax=Deinococcus irradiatisoli TaxID=2202254 RepID=A0A2Z3JJY5_9DEIO|nr:FmdB family transcriptional regulator [Deinococcus irradiatisoli]
MPMYVYRNLNTGETFELKQSMKDSALTEHPETGEPIKRLVSAPAIAFKGSGFYATDSRASTSAVKTAETSKNDTSKSDTPAASDSSKSAESKTPTASAPAPSTPAASGGSSE